MMIILDNLTLETLNHLSVPLVLCDESGQKLGTFAPDRDQAPHDAPPDENARPARPDPNPWAHLGGSVGIYGYASDLE